MARTNQVSINYKQLISNIKSMYTHSSDYVYWYGGKDNKCTSSLLSSLSKQYPSIYTAMYYRNCQTDIKNKKRCIDCSGLVCKVYNIKDVGTEQFGQVFKEYHGQIQNGMVVYRKGHCGIFYNGRVLEAKGQLYDICYSKFKRTDWTRAYYAPSIDYQSTSKEELVSKDLLSTAIETIYGMYGNGNDRRNRFIQMGYSESQMTRIQDIINYLYKQAQQKKMDITTYLRSMKYIK